MSKCKIAVIIPTRLNSGRLLEKALLPFGNTPVIRRIIKRCPYHVICAIPDDKLHDAYAKLLKKWGVKVFRGHPTDCLKRVHDCAVAHDIGTIIRITHDCPFINTELIELSVKAFEGGYLGMNAIHGLNVEVFDMDTLKEAMLHGPDEHVTTWMRKQPFALEFPSLELNTPEDYKRLTKLL